MAKITTLYEVPAERTKVHSDVECGYRMFSSRGHRYLQLDTYGSNEREIPGKVSQSLQFDRVAAEELVEILVRAFPGICRGQ